MNTRLGVGGASLVALAVLSFLTFSAATRGFDTGLTLAINQTAFSQSISSVLVVFSLYGREYFWIPVVVILLLFGRRDTKLLAVQLAGLFIIGIVVGEILKFTIFRPHPYEVLSGIMLRVPADTDSSFPSGHAIIVSIGAFFALEHFKVRWVKLLLAVEAAVVCYSRVYVGMHWVTDVFAGVLVGAAIVTLGELLLRKYFEGLIQRTTDAFARFLGAGWFSV